MVTEIKTPVAFDIHYVASDGTVFTVKEDAEKYERSDNCKMTLVRRHLTQRNQNHQDHEEGYWAIFDEGPIDYGSSGRPVQLAVVKGTFIQTIKYAISLPGFWGYGPGFIKPIKVVDLAEGI